MDGRKKRLKNKSQRKMGKISTQLFYTCFLRRSPSLNTSRLQERTKKNPKFFKSFALQNIFENSATKANSFKLTITIFFSPVKRHKRTNF